MKKNRNSSVELLRILACFFVIAGHFIDQGIGFSNVDNASISNLLIIFFWGSGARIAVNVFIFISVWFISERDITEEWCLDKAIYIFLLMLFMPFAVSLGLLVFKKTTISETLGIYLFHQIPTLYAGLWRKLNVLDFFYELSGFSYLFSVVMTIIIVFLLGLLADFLFSKIVLVIMKAQLFKNITGKIKRIW